MKPFSFFKDPEKVGKVTLIFLLAVIAWGAFVRASGSGAGCGSHWPLCNGQVLPTSSSTKTWIEFTHRATSGLSLALCVFLFWSVFRRFPKNSFSRKGATATLIFIILEALLGAGLVLLELVAENKSLLRTVSLGVHLLNTFFLLAAITLTTDWASKETKKLLEFRPAHSHFGLAFSSFMAVVGVLILGASGAMTALGDTLFPSSTVADGLAQDLSPTSHFLIQLRVFHPGLALIITLYLLLFALGLNKRLSHEIPGIFYLTTLLAGFQLAQLLLGVMNILLLAPTVIQLAHLMLADGIWILLVLTLSSVWILPKSRMKSLKA